MAVTVSRTLQDYADLLDRPAPVPLGRVPMDRIARAAQFSSFKALNGFEDSIEETGRLTEEQPQELQQGEGLWYIADRMGLLQEHLKEKPEVTARWFVADRHKPGGSYREAAGRVKRIDSHQGLLILYAENGISDGVSVPVKDITKLDSELFSQLLW